MTTATGKIPAELVQRLCCPRCKAPARLEGQELRCSAADCAETYPIVAGIPVMLNDEASLFTRAGIVAMMGEPPRRVSPVKQWIRSIIPPISRNYRAAENYAKLSQLLAPAGCAHVLVLGAGISPAGLDALERSTPHVYIESDVVPGPRTAVICDAHDIPFEDRTFDAVIIQGVICWLQDPVKAVGEIHRVLKTDGLVYAETPFVQQNTGGPYDFVRFTHVGHRRLFRHFAEVVSGPVGGPGMVLAWSWSQFLMTLAGGARTTRSVMRAIASFTSFWLPLLDRWLGRRTGSVDGASGVFFLGRRSDEVIADRDVIKTYRGLVR